MNLGRKGFLQGFEEGLDEVPLGAPHVDDDGEATFAHVLTVGSQRSGTVTQRLSIHSQKASGNLHSFTLDHPSNFMPGLLAAFPSMSKCTAPKSFPDSTPPTKGILLLLALSKKAGLPNTVIHTSWEVYFWGYSQLCLILH